MAAGENLCFVGDACNPYTRRGVLEHITVATVHCCQKYLNTHWQISQDFYFTSHQNLLLTADIITMFVHIYICGILALWLFIYMELVGEIEFSEPYSSKLFYAWHLPTKDRFL